MSGSQANCQELHPQNFNSCSHFSLLLLRVFWEWGFFLACCFPKWPAFASSLFSGDVFPECPFPTRPWEHHEGAAVLAFPLLLQGEAWVHKLLSHTEFVHLRHSCSALHFWLSEHVEHVRIGVWLGVHPSRDNRHGFSFQGLSCYKYLMAIGWGETLIFFFLMCCKRHAHGILFDSL